MAEYAVEMLNITKRFPGIIANDNITLQLKKGEIHALLGALAGFVFHWPGFWIYIMLKIDQFIKAVWCVFRLRSGKWIKKIHGTMPEKEPGQRGNGSIREGQICQR